MKPSIWRRIELRSDLSLDRVHEVLQVGFEWTDSHVHRFSIGGGPFDRDSELFLCPWDAEDPDRDEDGIPTSQVRLDETLHFPGDRLHYIYGYGDSWEITLRLEQITPTGGRDVPAAAFTGGRGASPEEDSRGLESDEELGSTAAPVEFDVEAANQALQNPLAQLHDHGIDHRLVTLLSHLPRGDVRDRLAARAFNLTIPAARPADDAITAALTPVTWFLRRAADGGIPLTAAGYLRPDDVTEASRLLPRMQDWVGKNNRENLAAPLLDFRTGLQDLGLLRKYRNQLLLTRPGRAASHDPAALWQHLTTRLVPAGGDTYEQYAALLTLLTVASSTTKTAAEAGLRDAATALTDLGWTRQDHRRLQWYDITRSRHNPLPLLDNLDHTPSPPAPSPPPSLATPSPATTERATPRNPAIGLAAEAIPRPDLRSQLAPALGPSSSLQKAPSTDLRVRRQGLPAASVMGVTSTPRDGARPDTSAEGPHRQLTQKATPELWGRLVAEVFALPGVEEGISQVSPASSRAVFLADQEQQRDARTSLAPGRRLEPVHLHGVDDTSVHLCLPENRGRELTSLGWTEPHQFEEFGTEFMIYGPRSPEELKTVLSVIEESIAFARQPGSI